ncbi:histidine kinase [Sphingomonas sp. MM-1]|uniref:sensor histidine kinase n=1 Tax=Sphingomonas sp. MM-1 TaxID=745310 RepID=UPI0002C0921B|nr:HAMP domain-containing sensor histidine kinase [Sphingomonas sp. MM-1]AGH51336.1 histidine kinase [Sphingomonas sp. MM-1]
MMAPIHGRLDRDFRLVEADAALEGLHLRAGGLAGGVLAVPQVASIARLARRLGIVVSRGVIAADGETDLELWVRAEPQGEGVALAIAGWTARPAADSFPATTIDREHDFIRASADWLWETDDALKITALSPGVVPSRESMLGQPLTKLVTLRENEAGVLPILDAIATQRRFDDQEGELREGGGGVRLSAVPIFDAAGRFAGLRGAAVAISPPSAPVLLPVTDSGGTSVDRVQAEAFGRRLDTALRDPLDRIIASAEHIRAQADGPLRRDYANYAADIAAAGRHLLALVDDLVDLQAIERPDFAPAIERLDIADAVRRAAGLLGGRAADRGVRIDRPAADEALPVQGDFRRALQVLVNIIGNAVRHSPEGGAVWLRCERQGSYAAVTVADQGRGIDPADHERIFEKFERLQPGDGAGTGLGLYIARRLARAMGGDLTVESQLGQGARFTFTLPAVEPGQG